MANVSVENNDTNIAAGTSAAAFHASRMRTAGKFATSFSVLKVYIGAGVLGLPLEFRNSGLVASLCVMLLLSLMSIHTLFLLLESKLTLVSRQHDVTTFGDLCVVAFGRFGNAAKLTVDVLLVFTQVGFCCAYLIFLSNNTNTLLGLDVAWQFWVILWMIVAGVLVMIRTVKTLGPLAAAATCLLGISLVVILIASIINWSQMLSSGTYPPINLVSYQNIPNTIGTAIFSFEGIGFILPAQTAVKRPEIFKPLVTVCISIIASVYIFFGTFGYLGFGDQIKDRIVDNLLSLDGAAWPYIVKVILVFLLFAIAITYPMQMFVATDILEHKLFDPADKSRSSWYYQSGFRLLLVAITGIIALVIPKFNMILALIGSLGSSPLQYILPSMIYYSVHRKQSGIAMKTLLITYTVLGFVFLVLGTFTSLRDIIGAY